ncbi:hypothetical protein CDD81_7430 [Ophiocordyceps australis]|uniref:Uncharacterized protein n=1 Tax=Ophiocordyceps australis TaxID=1399860 RepID=A0A2C5YA48_9HYPO|nr:hypothetical protein CDD81_7430 [Ophiocordyceps australis]
MAPATAATKMIVATAAATKSAPRPAALRRGRCCRLPAPAWPVPLSCCSCSCAARSSRLCSGGGGARSNGGPCTGGGCSGGASNDGPCSGGPCSGGPGSSGPGSSGPGSSGPASGACNDPGDSIDTCPPRPLALALALVIVSQQSRARERFETKAMVSLLLLLLLYQPSTATTTKTISCFPSLHPSSIISPVPTPGIAANCFARVTREQANAAVLFVLGPPQDCIVAGPCHSAPKANRALFLGSQLRASRVVKGVTGMQANKPSAGAAGCCTFAAVSTTLLHGLVGSSQRLHPSQTRPPDSHEPQPVTRPPL